MKQLSFYLFIIVCLNACNANKYVYSPSTANLLNLEKKNDVKMALNYSTVGNLSFGGQNKQSNGVDVQTAYAINNKIAIKLDGYIKRESNQSGIVNDVVQQSINYKKKGIELSAGYFNLNKGNSIASFQAYAGFALGNATFYELDVTTLPGKKYFYDISFNKYFLQPAVNFRVNKNYNITLATKFSLISFKNPKTDYPNLSKEALGYINTKPSFFGDFIVQNEFGVNGLEGISFHTQIGTSTLYTNFESPNSVALFKSKYEYNNIWFMVGVVGDLKKLFTKK